MARIVNKKLFSNEMARRQGIFWCLTIPGHAFTPYLPPGYVWVRGQLECAESGFIHWQLLVACSQKKSLVQICEDFGPYHAELSRSEAAADYVWKDATRIQGTQFELGFRPFRRNSKPDWDAVWASSVSGDCDAIPASLRFVHYRTIRSIAADHARPVPIDRIVNVFWGRTGTGKSRRAWDEAGMDAYCKDPRSKFWCGYKDQKHVVLDEFRGGIDPSHLLRWLDRYPVIVEVKGSSRPLLATTFWITSNVSPDDWYPELDAETRLALRRRYTLVTHFDRL